MFEILIFKHNNYACTHQSIQLYYKSWLYLYIYQDSHVSEIIRHLPVHVSTVDYVSSIVLCHNGSACLPRVVCL